MEDLVLLDSSVLISYYRKKNKEQSFFYQLSADFSGFCISVITEFETICGGDKPFWQNLFTDFIIVPYSTALNTKAVDIRDQLKRKRTSIEFRDLIIATTAIHLNIPLATMNEKHFSNIENLELITPKLYGL
jgi:predicted nucleic acid-binding protein